MDSIDTRNRKMAGHREKSCGRIKRVMYCLREDKVPLWFCSLNLFVRVMNRDSKNINEQETPIIKHKRYTKKQKRPNIRAPLMRQKEDGVNKN